MTDPACSVCTTPLGTPLYESGPAGSLTSLCRLHPNPTRVRACAACGHLQTDPIADVEAYYDAEYDILVGSDEEDQIYEVRDGTTVYRTAHQVAVLRALLAPGDVPLRLLDYGCAKSSTIRALCADVPAVVPHLFDVSARYVPFWEKFVAPGHWAINETPADWAGSFDVVTSFFSLEHIPDVRTTLARMTALLRDDGVLYAVVPDVLGNVADFIVVDHCNHFTPPSLRRLFADAGLDVVVLDSGVHRGAHVVVARKRGSRPAPVPAAEVDATCARLAGIGAYWAGAAARVRAFEESLAADEPIAVYGAGFYGAFVAAALARPERIACHVDQNPFLQGGRLGGRPIVAPADLPADVGTLFIGLNPAHARAIVAGVPAFAGRGLRLHFL